MDIEFAPLQTFLPKEKLKQTLDRALINVINEVEVDINDVLNDLFNELIQKALEYICGYGPRKLKQLILDRDRQFCSLGEILSQQRV